jgi:hypothetical protein
LKLDIFYSWFDDCKGLQTKVADKRGELQLSARVSITCILDISKEFIIYVLIIYSVDPLVALPLVIPWRPKRPSKKLIECALIKLWASPSSLKWGRMMMIRRRRDERGAR